MSIRSLKIINKELICTVNLTTFRIRIAFLMILICIQKIIYHLVILSSHSTAIIYIVVKMNFTTSMKPIIFQLLLPNSNRKIDYLRNLPQDIRSTPAGRLPWRPAFLFHSTERNFKYGNASAAPTGGSPPTCFNRPWLSRPTGGNNPGLEPPKKSLTCR